MGGVLPSLEETESGLLHEKEHNVNNYTIREGHRNPEPLNIYESIFMGSAVGVTLWAGWGAMAWVVNQVVEHGWEGRSLALLVWVSSVAVSWRSRRP